MACDGLSEKISNLIDATGPYEAWPTVCVAVSGGGDSMALALLLDRWVRARGGRLISLTVDHQLRTDSAIEARQVGDWLSGQGIEHHILKWHDPKATSALQENARAARYALMEDWCQENGILHLFLAHNAEDQAETFLMRLDKGSGPDGLSAMSAVTERRHCRLVRPLLSVSGGELRAFLADQGQGWVEDPSNQNDRFERIRWRRMMTEQGISPDGICRAAERYGQARGVLEYQAARLSARTVAVHPAGFIRIDRQGLLSAPEELGRRVLARALMAVGGAVYPPRRHKQERLMAIVSGREKQTRTLGGCQIECRDDNILIARELRALPRPLPVRPGTTLTWDRRFRLNVIGGARDAVSTLLLQPLGEHGERSIKALQLETSRFEIPRIVRLALPSLVDEKGVLSVPHLNYSRVDRGGNRLSDCTQIGDVAFRSLNSLSGSGYFVAK